MNSPRALQPLKGAKPRKLAHSERLAFPRMIAPAARNCRTITASLGTSLNRRAREPAVVCILSCVAMLSLSKTGMPWSGPRICPALRSWSRCSAI